MKRTLAVAAALALVAGLSACAGSDAKPIGSAASGGGVASNVGDSSQTPEADEWDAMDGDVAVPDDDENYGAVDTHADLFSIYTDDWADDPTAETMMKVKAYEDAPESVTDALGILDAADATFVRVTVDNRGGDDEISVSGGMVTDESGKTYELDSLVDTVSLAYYDADVESAESETLGDAAESLQEDVPAGAIGTQWLMAKDGIPDQASRFVLDIGGFETDTPVSEVADAEGSNAFDPGALDFTDPNEK